MKKFSLICLSIAILFLLFLIAIPFIVMHELVDNKVEYATVYNSKDYGIESKKLMLQTDDNYNVRVFEVCPSSPKAVIICLTGIEKPSVTAFFGHAKMFYHLNYATLLLEVRGHGESDGDKICLGYQETHDVKAVTDYIKNSEVYKDLPVVIMGLSMGAGIAINSMAENNDLDALISISSYSSFEDMFVEFMADMLPEWIATCEKPFVQLTSMVKYGVNPWEKRPESAIRHLNGRPALLMHTTKDSNVSYDNYKRIMENAPAHVDTLLRDVDEHFFTNDFLNPQADALYYTTIATFISKTIEQ